MLIGEKNTIILMDLGSAREARVNINSRYIQLVHSQASGSVKRKIKF